MPDQPLPKTPSLVAHGAPDLPEVRIDTYNEELRDAEGFVGDRASNRAFRAILEDWRERLRGNGDDPLGDVDSNGISKRKLDKLLLEGDPEAAGLVHAAIEDFAQELATVIRRFLRLKSWRGTERIVVGGGLSDSRIGELAVGRAAVVLKADGIDIELRTIRNHPDEAGLLGAVHLAPSWIFAGHDSLLAADIGGSNIRAGIVVPGHGSKKDAAAKVIGLECWRHADDKPTREEAVERLAAMLDRLIVLAKDRKMRLAPFIGIGCPGLIGESGSIERGGQNLPGNWESSRFNLPERLVEAIPEIGDHRTVVVMHNDAVIQGLSELDEMQDVSRWGVLTIGTGLGNARFTNHQEKPAGKPRGRR